MKGQIHWGINNIFGVYCEGEFYECRIKGKVLKEASNAYNPLSPGDWVEWEQDLHQKYKGLITARLERHNAYSRWNKNRRQAQTIACNLDDLVLVTCLTFPRFQPSFLDRALLMAKKENISALILVNKCDQLLLEEQVKQISIYQNLGWQVFFCSATTGQGIEVLRQRLHGKVCALVGQSGVGKSSLFNALHPQAQQKVGRLCAKHALGSHTTNFSFLQLWPSGQGGLIDTPGVRNIDVFGLESSQLISGYPEFQPFLGHCEFSACTHIQEPGCAVLTGVEARIIYPGRWETYKRLFQELRESEKKWI